VRRMLSEVLASEPDLEVVGTAPDSYVARDKIISLRPDVLTLDIEMPRMDGLTFMRVLQKHRPMPVVVVSSLTQAGSSIALDALEAGAVDVIAKPNSAWGIGDLGAQLCHRVKGAAAASLKGNFTMGAAHQPASLAGSTRFDPRQIILFGASNGRHRGVEICAQPPAGRPAGHLHRPAHPARVFQSLRRTAE